MSAAADHSRMERLARERDLYRRILELGGHDELEPFLGEALELVVELTGARQGYLQLDDVCGADDAEPWSISYECSDEKVEEIRETISQGIIARALAEGELVETASAINDPRFKDSKSVQAGRIEAVLCAPIRGDAGRGALYLQGGVELGPFPTDDHAQVRTLGHAGGGH